MLSPQDPNNSSGRTITVTAPASSANLGSGFDVLAVALDLTNVTVVTEIAKGLVIEVEGEGADGIPTDAGNLFYRSMQLFFDAYSCRRDNGWLIHCVNAIPLGRGLGSSATTIVSGLLAAREISGLSVPDDEVFQLAATSEGHADNVAACLYGGCTISLPASNGHWLARHITWPDQLACALYIPNHPISTETARAVLPETYARADVVHNVGAVALLVNALTNGHLDDLAQATQDRLHQPYREALMPAMMGIINAALAAGACASFLSGAGSAVAALYDRERISGDAISEAMMTSAAAAGSRGRVRLATITTAGAQCQRTDQAVLP